MTDYKTGVSASDRPRRPEMEILCDGHARIFGSLQEALGQQHADYRNGVRAAVAILFLLVALCVAASAFGQEPECVHNKDCPEGLVCVRGACKVRR